MFRKKTLKNDLFVMRQAIDTYTLDKQKPPQSLKDLVDTGYLPRIPADPFTNKPNWTLQIDEVAQSTKVKTRGLQRCPFEFDADGTQLRARKQL